MAEVMRDAAEGAIRSDTLSGDRRQRALTVVGKFHSGKKNASKEHDGYLTEAFEK